MKDLNRHIGRHTLLDWAPFHVFLPSPGRHQSHRRLFGCLFLSFALLAGACGNTPQDRKATPESIPRMTVDWTKTARSVDVGDGWTVRGCPAPRPALCVERDKKLIGHVLLEDVPSLGEEKTTSGEQVQAVLAVRIHTDYKSFEQQRHRQCGEEYEIKTVRPSPTLVAGQRGLRYGATGSMDGQVLEKTIGYRVFRDGIESLIEATAIRPGGCVVPRVPGFSIQQLNSFEKAFDRLIASSRLPPAAAFPEPSITVPAGNVDPRMGKGPTYGIGIANGQG